MEALTIVVTFRDMMMNQTKLLVQPAVSLKRVTANAVLVHAMDVMVNVTRTESRIIILDRSLVFLRSQLCRPRPNCSTRAVVRPSVTRMVSCRQSVMLTHKRRTGLRKTH